MAFSLSSFLYSILGLLAVVHTASAETRNLDFDVGWVTANPDGLADRPVIGINGQWPLPFLNFTRGDQVVLNLTNSLGNVTTSIHFHGLFQNGTNYMDGPVGVTQCDIPAGVSMIYNFTVDQPGTYWYHTHTRGQIIDGFRAQFVVHDPQNPYNGQFDEEIALTLSDWYHDQAATLLPQFISFKNPTGAEPVPNSALMADTQNHSVSVQPGKTYYLRLTNVGTFAGHYFWIEGHTMKIIQVDGVYTEPADADMLYLSVAQRYGVLVTTKNDTSANFAMVGSMDTDLFDTIPDGLNYNVTGWLVYNDTADKPEPAMVDEFTDYDDFTLVPQDGLDLFDKVDYTISLDLKMDNLGDGANYAFFNDVTYTTPKVPTLFTTLSSGSLADNVAIYGNYTNSYVLKQGDVVELILNNNDGGKHPFHLHGHDFQVVVRSDENWGNYDPNNHTAWPAKPMRRDVVTVRPESNFAIRWRADNPGIWFFHCHINWHLDTGLAATFIEAPFALQNEVVPQNHYDVCAAGGTPFKGNAAGNTVDFLDLSGQPESVAPLPAGFTARGIVALVFSCVSAFLGVAVIAWYGAVPIGAKDKRLLKGAGPTSPTS